MSGKPNTTDCWLIRLTDNAYEVYEFSPGFTAEVQRTGVEPVNLVIIHILQHHFSDILRCAAVYNM